MSVWEDVFLQHTLRSRCSSPAANADVRVGRVQPLQDRPGERQQGECGGDGQGKRTVPVQETSVPLLVNILLQTR